MLQGCEGDGSWRESSGRRLVCPGFSRSSQGCAQRPTATHLVRCVCSAARSAAVGALKVLGADEGGGPRNQLPHPLLRLQALQRPEALTLCSAQPGSGRDSPAEVLCFLSVASPGAELQPERGVADERHPGAVHSQPPSKAFLAPALLTLPCHLPQSRGFPSSGTCQGPGDRPHHSHPQGACKQSRTL